MLHLLLVHVSFAHSSKNPTRLNFGCPREMLEEALERIEIAVARV
ncbi:MAG: hypothetical protein ACFN26_02585 [Kingella denitrificans]